jgi:GT2 family glycosyltransferase
MKPSRIIDFAANYFDFSFYSRKYNDVPLSQSGGLDHFLMQGIAEGRSPHPLIDIDFLRLSRPEISQDWLAKYLEHGWKSGWSCSPLINFPAFRRANPDWVSSGVSPLEFLCQKLSKGLHVRTGALSTELLNSQSGEKPLDILRHYVFDGLGIPVTSHADLSDHIPTMTCSNVIEDFARIQYWSQHVSLVIPIHSDHPVTRAMLDYLSNNIKNIGIDVVLVLDGCQDQAFIEYTRGLANYGFKILENPTALGFSASVNLGVSVTVPSNHLLILNADVFADLNSLANMLEALESDSKLASITSLTNFGSIASYPVVGRETRWLPVELPKLAQAFSANTGSGLLTYVPTCVGHCVLIRRKAWDMLGWFEAANFPQGYGEEVDWSIRASAEGWSHAIANRSFVWHQGSTSFGERKTALKKAAEKTLNTIHGNYFSGFQEKIKTMEEQLKELFQTVECQLIAQDEIFTHAIITHSFGGGTYEFIDRQNVLDDKTLLVFLEDESNTFRLGCGPHFFPNLVNKRFPLSELTFVLNQMKIPTIDLHTGVAFNSYAFFMKLRALDAELTIYLHDFSPFCARVNLIGGASDKPEFCGGGTASSVCQVCIEKHGSNIGTLDIKALRILVEHVFYRAAKVIVPSESAQKMWKKWDIETTVFTHPTVRKKCLTKVEDRLRQAYFTDERFNSRFVIQPEVVTSPFRVLVPGRISVAKGAALIEEVLRLNRTLGTPIEFILCGMIDRTVVSSPSGFTMEINDYQGTLPQVCIDLNIDAVWLSSICPETHCYVLDDIGVLPSKTTIVLNESLGAPLERSASLGFTDIQLVAPDSAEIMTAFLQLKARLSEMAQ